MKFYHVSRKSDHKDGKDFTNLQKIIEKQKENLKNIYPDNPKFLLQLYDKMEERDTFSNWGYRFFWDNFFSLLSVATVVPVETDYLCSLLIDLFYELIRQVHFKNCPSRFESVFAFKEKTDVKKFVELVKCHDNCKILTLDVKIEDAFEVDMNLLRLGNNFAEIEIFAKRYWSQEKSDEPILEYFLPKTAKIVSISDLNHFLNQ